MSFSPSTHLALMRAEALGRAIDLIGCEGVSECCSGLPPAGFGLLTREDMPFAFALQIALATGWQVTPQELCPETADFPLCPASALNKPGAPGTHVMQGSAA